ncbi:hypothetical protein ElyMa_001623500 [Elysia marginata]|uniref:Uncharacterized protein n=1 Tax=Elysia marginata TaxID=1093978 RepID=A0AAV4JJ06_9GAST|nr:hypothetical protein ElyMa_001623500 [Elysia marginata]
MTGMGMGEAAEAAMERERWRSMTSNLFAETDPDNDDDDENHYLKCFIIMFSSATADDLAVAGQWAVKRTSITSKLLLHELKKNVFRVVPLGQWRDFLVNVPRPRKCSLRGAHFSILYIKEVFHEIAPLYRSFQ